LHFPAQFFNFQFENFSAKRKTVAILSHLKIAKLSLRQYLRWLEQKTLNITSNLHRFQFDMYFTLEISVRTTIILAAEKGAI